MASSAVPTAQPYVVEDCRGVLQLLSDGTVVRSGALPFPVGNGADHEDGRVEWKDAVYDAGRCLGLRMYKPTRNGGEEGKKLPVLVYFHGGGFCIGSFAWPNFHAGCLRLAAEIPAVVLSFDYRLAPEHRLPAAHEDAAAALLWLRDQLASDPWVAGVVDPHRVFVSGESAGGNIAHHLALRFGTAGLDPVRIAGYILLMPAFLSEQPTQSELDTPATAFLTREASDRYTRLFLPAGANKDHPLVNPFASDAPSLDKLDVGRMLVVAAEGDMLRDKNVEYAERLRAARGDEVELLVFAGEEHAFFALKPTSKVTGELIQVIRRFLSTEATN
ncbi:probable carboxylesterase 15 [Lolium rigidum]|uniref:probable carboxylesterase 15 n=1 Tax=Lolium rigidum TaxID=89674 RepID=UPI001F5D2A39|nr:probable carboxylesterase 15 [Lolium rigidum]